MIIDDSPAHLDRPTTEDLLKREWGDLAGPATWLRLTRIA